jgi:hypothetical protein
MGNDVMAKYQVTIHEHVIGDMWVEADSKEEAIEQAEEDIASGFNSWVVDNMAGWAEVGDVYLDGKLARSCVLPNYFKVDSSYSGYLLSYGGFGGQIGNVMMYDAAINPEMVYKNYIAGPDQATGFWQWITSFFDIGVDVTVASGAQK